MFVGVEQSRNAEVGEPGVTGTQQNVLRLDVPVDHVIRVRVRQGIAEVLGDPLSVLDR